MSLRPRRRILSTTTQLPALAAAPAINPRLLTGATLRDDMQGQERSLNDADYAAQRQSLDMERQQVAADREAAKQETAAARQANTASTFAQELQYDAQGIQHRRNPVSKTVEPVPEPMTGRPITKNLEGPVEYDPMGRAVQTVRKDGVMSRQDLDANAPIGRNPKDKADPNIYVQNSKRPWDAYAPTDALVHSDPRIRTAAAQTMMTEDANALSSEEARIHAEMADPELKGITPAKREKAQERVAQGLAMEGDDKILEKAKIIDAKQRRLSEIGIEQASRGNMTAEEYAAKKLASLPADTVNISRQKLLAAQRTGIQALRAKLDEEDAAYAADYEAFLPQTQGFTPDQAPAIRQKMGQMLLRKQIIDAKRASFDEDVKKHEEFTATLNTQAVTAQAADKVKAATNIGKAVVPVTPTDLTFEKAVADARSGAVPWEKTVEGMRAKTEMIKADPAMPATAAAMEKWTRALGAMKPVAQNLAPVTGGDGGIGQAQQMAAAEITAANEKDAAAAAERKQAGAEAFRLVTSPDAQNAIAENYTPDERKVLEDQAAEYRRATFQDTWDEKAKPTHYSKEYGELNVNPSLLFKPDEYTKAVDTAEAPPLAKEKAMQSLPLMQQQAAPPIFEGFLSSGPTEQAFQNSIQKTIKDHGWPLSMRSTKDVMTKDWTPDQKALAVQEFMSRSDFSPNFNQIALGFSRGLDQLQQTAYGVGSFFGSDAAQKAGEAEIQQQDVQGAAAQAGGGSQLLGSLVSGATSLVPSLGAGILSGGAGLGVKAAMATTSAAAGVQSAGSTMIEAKKAGMSGLAARLTALGSGAITAGLTQLGGTSGTEAIIGKLFGKGGEQATMSVVRPTLAKAIVEKVKGYGIDGLKEAFLEEMPDQFFQNVLQAATYKPDQDLGEGLVETGIVSFLLGGGVNAATDVLGGAKEKLNITKEINLARIRRELGQQDAAQHSPEIITSTLAGSPMEAQTPDVLSKIADFDARIVDGQDQLAKATSKAQTLYSNRQLAQAYGQRAEYVNEVRDQLRDSFMTAANEEIDAAVPPSEDPAAAQTFEADKTRAKALVAIASGKTADLDNATLALVDLTRDEKGNLAPAKGKTDSPDGTPRVTMQDGQPVISQGAIDRMTGLFPATEPLIGKTENERRAEIIASTTAAEAAKQTDTKADVSAEETAQPPVAEEAAPETKGTTQQTFDVQVEGMADPVEITAATEAEARAAAIAQHPGKMIRSVVAVESEPAPATPGLTPSNPASAVTDSELTPPSTPQAPVVKESLTTQPGGLTPASINKGPVLNGTEILTPASIAKALTAAGGKRGKKISQHYAQIAKTLHREVIRWQAAFPGGIKIVSNSGSGGVQVNTGTSVPVLSLDFAGIAESAKELGNAGPAWMERAVVEEVIHSVAIQMEVRGEIDTASLFKSLPDELKEAVKKAYRYGTNDQQWGHEFFRMMVQQRLGGKKAKAGEPVLTEQSLPQAVEAKFKAILDKLLAYFRDMVATLKRQKASPETIARVVAAADMIEAGVRSLQETPSTKPPGKETGVSSTDAAKPAPPTPTSGAESVHGPVYRLQHEEHEGKINRGTYGIWFSSDPEAVKSYDRGDLPDFITATVKFSNPLRIDAKGERWDSLEGTVPQNPKLDTTDDVAYWAEQNGYDGVIIENVVDDGNSASDKAGPPSTIYSVFAADQVDTASLNTPADLKGAKIDKEWTAFADSTRSLGIPREDMPQIKTEHRGALANFLRAGGIEFTRETALPGSLHPTQAEYSPAKVKKAREWVGESNRAILVSSDNHVLDGHHQWMAALEENPTEPMDVIRLDAPIRELLAAVAQFPSAGMDAVPEVAATPDATMESYRFVSKKSAIAWMKENGIEKGNLTPIDSELFNLEVPAGDYPLPKAWYLMEDEWRFTDASDPDNGYGLQGPWSRDYMMAVTGMSETDTKAQERNPKKTPPVVPAEPEAQAPAPAAGPVKSPKLPTEKPADRDEWQKTYRKWVTALTKAQNAQDWNEVIRQADAFDAFYTKHGGFPDQWSNWVRAKDDAELYLRRPDIAPKLKAKAEPKAKPEPVTTTAPAPDETPREAPGLIYSEKGIVYADTRTLQIAGTLAGYTVDHIGMGDFDVKTPLGKVSFSRMDGMDKVEGQSGRLHAVQGSNEAVDAFVKTLRAEGAVEPVKAAEPAVVETEPAAPLSASSQKMKAALDAIMNGTLQSQPIAAKYNRDIPPAAFMVIMEAAQGMVNEGTNTPETLARELTSMGMSYRTFSEAIWSAMGATSSTLRGITPDWNAIYSALDKPDAAEEAPAPEAIAEPVAASPQKQAADALLARMVAIPAPLSWRELFAITDKAWGGTQAEGAYTVKDAYDALELAVNRQILQGKAYTNATQFSADEAVKTITDIENNILARLPTQTKRTAESDALQQFSTPPQFAYLANWAAGVRPGDVMWETSAGIGGLAVFSKAAGATVLVNEFSARRREFLKELPFDHMFGENAEMMNAIMEPRIQRGDVPRPTVVVINPPFSNGAESGKKKDTTIGAKHLEEAMKLLEPGGRMVAIMGEGMSITAPTFRGWFQRMGRIYNVRANIHVDGSNYAKYGTSFSNRIIIIDKTGPTPDLSAVVGGSVDKITELPQLLEGIHNDRTTPTSAQQSGSTATEGQTAVPGTVPSPDPVTGGRRPDGRPGRRGGVGTTRADGPKPDNGNGTPDAAATGDNRGTAGLPGGPDGSPDRNADTGNVGGLTINSERRNAATDDEDGSIFSSYRPSKVSIPGSKPHPANLVESAAMASVEAPDPVYTPNLPAKISSEGLLSEIQLENVVYAGQAHAQTLPDGERKGYFIGDGTGVGKGRQIYGIILDNMRQGRKKAVWVSKSAGLLTDARRDAEGLEGDPTFIFSLPKAGADIARGEGILFTTYDTLRGKHVEGGIRDHGKWVEQTFALETPASRLEQLVRWLGKDFDGVIAFDEAHKAGNAVPTKGTRGFKKASLNGITVVDLQKVLPNARIVYVSATGATEVTNLSFADRLGLWGTGTPFPTKQAFFDKISAGGISAMEIVARDMKALGVYLARSISFKGVGFSRVTQDLTPEQTETYNGLARGWQLVLRNMNEAMVMTDGNKSSSQATAVKSQFWGAQQRFFNSLLTAMEIPALVRSMDERLAAGDSAVLQLVNTNEAQQKRAIAKALTEAGDGESNLDDLDLSPKDILLNLINNSFPTYVHHQVPDPANPEKQVWVRLLDADGNPVADPAAVALKEETLTQVQMLPTPDGALDQILDHYGSENVAEVTGRGQRLVRKKNEAGVVVRQIERRNDSRRKVEAQEFQEGKRKILVFSDAGGTGYSYHADLKAKNQTKRAHYLVQAGWRADGALQGFGRTHRSNQAQPPFYYLVDTNIKGHRRFLSTIARRLAQLGALTAGERKATGQGMFSESDNLEGQYADDALMRLISDIHANEVEGWDLNSFAEKMGFGKQDVDRNSGEPIFRNDLIDPETGGLNRGNVPGIPQFLNRLLALELDDQNFIFDQFDNRLAARVQRAQDDGTFDPGTQQYKAKSMRIVDDQTVYEHPGTTAKTRIVDTEVTNDVSFTTFEEMESMYSGDTGVERFLKNKKSGRVFAIRQGRELTSKETGAVVQGFRRIGTRGNIEMLPESELTTGEEGRYDVIPASAAKAEWDAEIAAADPVTKKKESFIVGALLPIWDRIGQAYPKIFRFTDAASGQSLLGVLIPQKDLAATRNRLGAGKSVTPEQAYSAVIEDGSALTLANGWSVNRVRLSGDYRLEVRGLAYNDLDQFKNVMNGIVERVAYNTRFFLPTGEMGIPSMEKLLQRSPVVKIGGEDVGASDGTALQAQSPASLARSVDAPDGFYSAAVKLLDQKMPARASKEQVKAILASAKPDEVKWSGVMPWIDAQPDTITKEAVTGFMRGEGRVKFEEVRLGKQLDWFVERGGQGQMRVESGPFDSKQEAERYLSNPLLFTDKERETARIISEPSTGDQFTPARDNSKYAQYQLPGGINYREVVLAMPMPEKLALKNGLANKMDDAGDWNLWDERRGRFVYLKGYSSEDALNTAASSDGMLYQDTNSLYKSNHFADVPNYVAHMRLNDRVDGYGAPGLLIEEIQSYRGQMIRKESGTPNEGKTPSMPFEKTWPLQMFKRALRDAVDAGKQWIGWTTGQTQNDRFDLSKQVRSITWNPYERNGSTKLVTIEPTQGNTIELPITEAGVVIDGVGTQFDGKPLDEVVGKDLAEKIIGAKRGDLSGDGLRIGGSGMKGFYDGILPKEISKYVKQWGGKVERTAMEKPSPIDGRSLAELEASGEIDNAITGLSKDKINAVAIWRVNITPEMAATVATVGQPLYAQSPKRLLRELGVNSDEIAARAARASQEESGARTVIDPTRSMGAGVNTEGAGNDTILATSDLYAQEVTAETVAQWDESARAMLAADYEGTFKAITAAARKGGILSPELTRAAQMLTEAESRRPMTKTQMLRMQLLVWSNRLAGTEAARSLRARVDPFKTPAQRHREAIAKSIFMPPPETRAAIESAETPEERSEMILKDSRRIAAIQAALAKMGLTIDDILAGDRMLVARRHDMFRQFVGSNLSAAELAASTELIDGAVTFEAAAAKHGISSEKLKQSFQQSVDSIGAELDRRREMAKAAMGKPSPLNTAPVGADPWVAFDFQGGAMMTDEEWAASKKAIMESMGLFPANQQGKRRTATRRPAPRTPGEAKDTIKIDRGRSVEVSILKGADLSDVTDVYRIMRIHSAAASNGFDMLREYWINNLLSGPVTQFKNATSNLLFGTWNLVASRGLESLVNIVARNDKSASMGEFTAIMKSLAPAWGRGVRLAKLAWETESDHFAHMVLDEHLSLMDTGPAGEYRQTAIPGKVGRVVRMPGRALMFADGFFKGLFGTMEAAAHAHRIAKAEGLAPGSAQFQARMDSLVAEPGSEAWIAAVRQAETNTFQNQLDPAKNPVDAVPKLIISASHSKHLMVRLVATLLFPFTKTPYNVYREGLRRSPLGAVLLAGQAAKAGWVKLQGGQLRTDVPPALIKAFAEQVFAWTGTLLLLSAIEGDDDDYDKKFLITGSAPKDRGGRDMQERTSGGAYVIKWGKTVIPYGGIEPIATVLGTVADMVRTAKTDGTVAEKTNAIFHAVKRGAIDKTFLQGLKGISDLLANDETSGGPSMPEKARRAVLQAIVPNIIRQPLRNSDSNVPDSAGAPWWWDAVPIPGEAEARVNAGSGEDKQRTGTAMSRIFIPSAIKPEENVSPIDKALKAWNRSHPDDEYNPQGVPNSMEMNKQRIDLSPKALHYLNKRSGTLARKMLANTKLSGDERSVKLIKKAYEDARSRAREELKRWPLPQIGTVRK